MDEQSKKMALRMITDGLYIITAASPGKIACSTVTWLNQKSFHPPMVTVSIKKGSFTHAVIEESKHFAIHLLGKDQKAMAEAFFRHCEPQGNTIAGYAFQPGVTGSPIFDACPAYFECKVLDRSDLGDHTTFIAEVIEAGLRREEKPLALSDTPWHYGG